MNGYKTQFLNTQPIDGDGVDNKVIVVVFTDLSADRAKGLFGDVLKQVALPSYEKDGILFGPFYEGNEGTAIYNSGFRPFQSPVPFLFVRQGVISDWKFFLDDDEWLKLWTHASPPAPRLAPPSSITSRPSTTAPDSTPVLTTRALSTLNPN